MLNEEDVLFFIGFLIFSLSGYWFLYVGYVYSFDAVISLGYFCIILAILFFIGIGVNIFKYICNQSKHKNPISTSVQSMNPQHPVIHEIQNIISNLSKLETNNKNRKAIFIKFNVIKRQFYVDYQKTIDMLVKLDKTKQNENQYWESFRRYLDLFKEQKDIIYKKLT